MDALTQLLDGKEELTVAFVDGRNNGPEMMLPYWYAEIEGFRTIQVPQPLRGIPEIVSFIQKHAQAAICANRLDHAAAGHFSGAELAAALYDAGIPTIVVTQYLEVDQHTSLREWCAKLPVVLHLREFSIGCVKDYLEFCAAELQGSIAESRAPYQVVLGVSDVEDLGGTRYVDVSVGCRDHYRRVRLPVSMIPEHLHPHLSPDTWFFARVNIYAQWEDELYFREFKRAPKPINDEDLVYCVNVATGESVNEDLSAWVEGPEAYERYLDERFSEKSVDMRQYLL